MLMKTNKDDKNHDVTSTDIPSKEFRTTLKISHGSKAVVLLLLNFTNPRSRPENGVFFPSLKMESINGPEIVDFVFLIGGGNG